MCQSLLIYTIYFCSCSASTHSYVDLLNSPVLGAVSLLRADLTNAWPLPPSNFHIPGLFLENTQSQEEMYHLKQVSQNEPFFSLDRTATKGLKTSISFPGSTFIFKQVPVQFYIRSPTPHKKKNTTQTQNNSFYDLLWFCSTIAQRGLDIY